VLANYWRWELVFLLLKNKKGNTLKPFHHREILLIGRQIKS
jgi:hypothetical protein